MSKLQRILQSPLARAGVVTLMLVMVGRISACCVEPPSMLEEIQNQPRIPRQARSSSALHPFAGKGKPAESAGINALEALDPGAYREVMALRMTMLQSELEQAGITNEYAIRALKRNYRDFWEIELQSLEGGRAREWFWQVRNAALPDDVRRAFLGLALPLPAEIVAPTAAAKETAPLSACYAHEMNVGDALFRFSERSLTPSSISLLALHSMLAIDATLFGPDIADITLNPVAVMVARDQYEGRYPEAHGWLTDRVAADVGIPVKVPTPSEMRAEFQSQTWVFFADEQLRVLADAIARGAPDVELARICSENVEIGRLEKVWPSDRLGTSPDALSSLVNDYFMHRQRSRAFSRELVRAFAWSVLLEPVEYYGRNAAPLSSVGRLLCPDSAEPALSE